MSYSGFLNFDQGDIFVKILSAHVHLHSIFLWGSIATLVLTALMEVCQFMGITRISMPYMLGTVFSRDERYAYLYGFLLHFLGGILITFGYGMIFEEVRASWWFGGLLGLLHGALVLTVGMRLLPYLHPRMAQERHGPDSRRWLQPPGFLATNYGRRTPEITFLAHLVFGIILGSGY